MKNDFQVATFDCSEDEMNNFWIDLYLQRKEHENRVIKPIGDISAIVGETVTITITKENYTSNYVQVITDHEHEYIEVVMTSTSTTSGTKSWWQCKHCGKLLNDIDLG